MNNLYKQLSEVKKEIGAISKDSTNPFYKSKYFDINDLLKHVEPILEKHGLIVLQPIEQDKVTTMIIDSKSGHDIQSSILLPSNPDPQKTGIAITYYRRYTLASLLALQSEDSDGNGLKEFTSKVATVEAGKGTQLVDLLKKFNISNEQANKYITLVESYKK
jgi:hypothetical protein